MKVRIGFGLGAANGHAEFTHVVDELERLRFDSLWVSERAQSHALDPMVAMTWAAARTTRLKVGASVMVLPGRNPVLLAKAIASLDQLSHGRALPAFGLGIANSIEHQAFGVERKERSAWFNEALPLMRRLWAEDNVTHHGERFQLDNASVLPKPLQQPIEVWLGGASDSELRRVGRMSDGWLPSFITPDKCAEGMKLVNDTAAEHDREIDPEHFGVLIPYLDGGGELPKPIADHIAKRQPDADPRDVVPTTLEQLHELVQGFIDIGATKFVVHPFDSPANWTDYLEGLADRLFPLQN